MTADAIPDRRSPLEMRVLMPADDSYPPWLRAISSRPPIVYVRGRLPPDLRCVACVGTRGPSAFGKAAARSISGFLAGRGWSIVSGLALGVDTVCHEAALEVGGHTVAVLANGLDSALPRHLTRRNRIQSGMSAATVVMQTGIVGGTMHTVKYALLQGRLLVAPVPKGAHADEPKSRGLLALTQRTGIDLARLLDARDGYADILSREFADRPVAMPLAGSEDYGALLTALESAIDGADLPPPAFSTRDPGSQLELFNSPTTKEDMTDADTQD